MLATLQGERGCPRFVLLKDERGFVIWGILSGSVVILCRRLLGSQNGCLLHVVADTIGRFELPTEARGWEKQHHKPWDQTIQKKPHLYMLYFQDPQQEVMTTEEL
jgi:hypothetical protein